MTKTPVKVVFVIIPEENKFVHEEYGIMSLYVSYITS